MLRAGQKIAVPDAEFSFSFARSGGAGGQNVNKVNTKAVLKWNAQESPSINAAVRKRFAVRYGNRINGKGEIVIAADTHRFQERNREECLKRLAAMLAAVEFAPPKRKATRPTRGSVKRRIDGKRLLREKKRGRAKIDPDT